MRNLEFFDRHTKSSDEVKQNRIKILKDEIKNHKMQYKLLLESQDIGPEEISLKTSINPFSPSDYRNRSYDIDIVNERIKLATVIEKYEKELAELEDQSSTLLHKMKSVFS